MNEDALKLENQLCFPVYAASRLITRGYQPLLDKLGLTYPQYLVLMILWEQDEIPVGDITQKLILNTNTVTPLLQRMEKQGLLKRTRSKQDERQVIVQLTKEGQELKKKAIEIPRQLVEQLAGGPLDLDDLIRLRADLGTLIKQLQKT
ncbi:MarR family transcriptional regulator [bacterium SCSIO 12741]|nr:MarR family transcriptional regulator [bacterium SCSIO 12741]